MQSKWRWVALGPVHQQLHLDPKAGWATHTQLIFVLTDRISQQYSSTREAGAVHDDMLLQAKELFGFWQGATTVILLL